jgi:CBS-domain-containing membrane protein
MDRTARTVCPTHSMAEAETFLAVARYNYLPVVDPRTDQLVGILSSTDLLRARHRAEQLLDKRQSPSSSEVHVVIPSQIEIQHEKAN